MRFLPLLFLLVFSLAALGEEITPVENLLRERLLLMKDVAAYKWQHHLAVADPAREQQVLASSVEAGLTVGLTADSSRAFFLSQIEAAREIQEYWINLWQAGTSPPAKIPDLASETRPRLLALGDKIIQAAAEQQLVQREKFLQLMTVEGLSDARRDEIFTALEKLSFYPDRLTQILDSGTLRIGTTGDYEPFSLRHDDGKDFRGIDIDMAKDLAAALGVEPVFVATSWPALLADLEAGKYDIAMGGVSRTLERQRRGFFSQPYHVDGKTALTRCVDKHRFASLADIDKPSVRVVVNPGGTNERFVDANIRHAKKMLYPDNRRIFSLLARGDADVMITDRIEAEWQAGNNTALCVPVAGNFTYQEKAYLMPRDIALKEFVDTWLSLRMAEGTLDPLLKPH